MKIFALVCGRKAIVRVKFCERSELKISRAAYSVSHSDALLRAGGWAGVRSAPRRTKVERERDLRERWDVSERSEAITYTVQFTCKLRGATKFT